MTPSFQALAKTLSPKAYAALANAFRSGTTLTGGAAINSAAKLLKGNAITAVVTTAVLTSFDVKDIVLGRISGAQLAVNFAKTTTTVVGGHGGLARRIDRGHDGASRRRHGRGRSCGFSGCWRWAWRANRQGYPASSSTQIPTR